MGHVAYYIKQWNIYKQNRNSSHAKSQVLRACHWHDEGQQEEKHEQLRPPSSLNVILSPDGF